MPTVINHTAFAGEDVTLAMSARDRSNLPLSLTGGTISWRVGRGPLSLDSSTPDISIAGTVTDSANGGFAVALSATTTLAMEGDYKHEAWLTNASAQSSIVSFGRLRILPYLTS